MVAIIDYGMGNIHSVQKALESMGARTIVTNKPADIKNCDKAVLPGVGAFNDAVLELKKQELMTAITEFMKAGKIFLGICLGMQLLFAESEEAKTTKGLGVLKGAVKKFQNKDGLKVPHMGWNQLKIKKSACPLLKDIPDNSYVYFCHSYYPQPQDGRIIAATTDYGVDFTSILWQDIFTACNFTRKRARKPD